MLPGLFEDDEDGRERPLLDLVFPVEDALAVELRDARSTPKRPHLMLRLATPQAITLPIVGVPRPPPRALVVFASYALLGAAIVIFAGALRWTRGERASAGTTPGALPFRHDADARRRDRALLPRRGTRAAGLRLRRARQAPAHRRASGRSPPRIDRGYAAGLRCASPL